MDYASMATASPSKNDRVERHLQRQRGAGARNLTTSFGFSFGLPLAMPTEPEPVAQPAIEPPTKRRKLSHCSREKTEALGPACEAITTGDADGIEPQVQWRTRRRLRAISEEPGTASRKADDESLVEATNVKKKRGRPRKAPVWDEFASTVTMVGPQNLDAEGNAACSQPREKRARTKKSGVVAADKQPASQVAKKRGRPRKLHEPYAVPDPCMRHLQPPAGDFAASGLTTARSTFLGIEEDVQPAAAKRPDVAIQDEFAPTDTLVSLPAKKRGRPKKCLPSHAMPEDAVLEVGNGVGEHGNKMATTGSLESRAEPQAGSSAIVQKLNSLNSQDHLSPSYITTSQPVLRPAKKPGRRKKAMGSEAMLESCSDNAVHAGGKDGVPATVSSSLSIDKARPGDVRTITVRPRRRAAADARSKVMEGFIEEGIPIDEKRRDPVAIASIAKRRDKTPVLVPQEAARAGEREFAHETAKSRSSKLSASAFKAAKVEYGKEPAARMALAETDSNASMTLSPRKLANHCEKHDPKPCVRKPPCQGSTVGARRGNPRKAQKLAIHPDCELLKPVEAPSAAFAHGATKARENGDLVPAVQNVEPTKCAENDSTCAKISGRNTMRDPAAQDQASLVIHAVQKPGLPVEANQSCQTSTLVKRASTQQDREKVTARTNRVTDKEKSAPRSHRVPSAKTGGKTTNTCRKTSGVRKLPTNDEDTEDNIDWLFAVPGNGTRALRKSAADEGNRQKRRRLASNIPDLDLDDDMLSSIAGYAADKHNKRR